ncbi:hypothetical protein [Methylobacterium oryzihabitans]|uniref:Uncharacterized protein n=1 Tax=Methylobacterium oryzihabitans TaxID=2499852 RepID=A0A437NW76_9HYPH|nr:hypothetical protein [Methylobacterium oryzihabitans]RVU14263.1 hypothetical protein EOE48_24075 [Methylobacterium oryzihabitans]
MSETPTPKQALVLWCLLGRQGTALQSEILPRVEKADREALVAGRFLTVERAGRSFRLTVADKGWRWAGEHADAPLPPNYRVLQDWLARVRRHLDAAGVTLAEFVGSPPEPEAPPPSRPRRRASGGSRKAKAAPPDGARAPAKIRARIEAAYLALTGGETARAIRLSALREKLADLDRAAVDAGLAAILRGDPTARLSQLTDPKALTAAERAAAYDPAGEPFHLIWIQR